MYCLGGCDIYKWLDIMDFSNKDEQDVKESTLLLVKSRRRTEPDGVVQPFMGWVDNKGIDINWDVRPVESSVNVLS